MGFNRFIILSEFLQGESVYSNYLQTFKNSFSSVSYDIYKNQAENICAKIESMQAVIFSFFGPSKTAELLGNCTLSYTNTQNKILVLVHGIDYTVLKVTGLNGNLLTKNIHLQIFSYINPDKINQNYIDDVKDKLQLNDFEPTEPFFVA